MIISRLHYITQELNGKTHVELAEESCIAGVDWVQLRVKNKSYEEYLSLAYNTKEICRKFNAVFIVNDNVSIVKEIQADGVHLGKNDMDPIAAREFLGDGFIIGGTANNMDDIRKLHEARVNYIGIGPFRFTATKEKLSPILGFDGYRNLIEQCRNENINTPLLAIGGIVPSDVKELLGIGLFGVAVSSIVNLSSDKKEVINEINTHFMAKEN